MSSEPKAKGENYADFSREELLAEIARLKSTKKYGLVWEHKKENVIEDFKNGSQPVLKEVTEKRIENAPGEQTNLIIEGDNFDALSILNYTHAGKVDVIYIDPPYNTRKNDFVYNDDYVQPDDDYKHSFWLSFMKSRLEVAKKLLSEDGCIFISIDDKELSGLRLLCDDVFGSERYVASIPRLTSPQRSGQENYMNISHDYILCYSYGDDFDNNIDREYDESKIKQDENGRYIEGDTKAIIAAESQGYSAGGDYDYEYNGKVYSPILKNGKRNRWLWSRARMEAADKLGILRETKNSIRMQLYLDKKFDLDTNTLVPKDSRLIFHTGDFMKNAYSNPEGTSNLENVAGYKSFSFPKPVGLIKKIIQFKSRKDAVILDFFAGSGTTGQAVLELNKEDGGHRQFVLCTNNGDKGEGSTKIAEEITYPRVKTVITGERTDGSKYSDGIPANLRYYKIEHEEKKSTNDSNRLNIVKYMEEIIQVKENAFEQIEVNEDIAIHKNCERYVAMVFDPFILSEAAELIKMKNTEKLPVKFYVFSYSRDALEEDLDLDFETEFVAMPEGLLKNYANIITELKKDEYEA